MLKQAGLSNDNKTHLIDEDNETDKEKSEEEDVEDDFLHESENGEESYGRSDEGNYSDGGVF
jgi:hypothetical protein